jgi:hypothetical protein
VYALLCSCIGLSVVYALLCSCIGLSVVYALLCSCIPSTMGWIMLTLYEIVLKGDLEFRESQ